MFLFTVASLGDNHDLAYNLNSLLREISKRGPVNFENSKSPGEGGLGHGSGAMGGSEALPVSL